VDYTYLDNFIYKHKNPYHDRLKNFPEFVFRDKEAEQFKGKWKSKIFNNKSPIHLEIGHGYGEFMTHHCIHNPEINFIGIDYRFKRNFSLAQKLDEIPNKNFRVLRAKGERLHFLFEENEIDKLFYFFPDPWPKTRHHKKRLFQEHFLNIIYKVLVPGGKILIKTDNDEYASWMKKIIDESPLFDLSLYTNDLKNQYPEHFLAQFETKFEKIFLEQNILIKAFELVSLKES